MKRPVDDLRLWGVAALAAIVAIGLLACTDPEEDVDAGTTSASTAATATPVPSETHSTGSPTLSPGLAKAVLPGGYEFAYPSSWSQILVSEDPYIAKFFLTPTKSGVPEGFADLEVTVYQNPEQQTLEQFYDGQERPNLFRDAAGGYEGFSTGGARGYWFDNVLGITSFTVVALSSGEFVYEFVDAQEHQSDGVFIEILRSVRRTEN